MLVYSFVQLIWRNLIVQCTCIKNSIFLMCYNIYLSLNVYDTLTQKYKYKIKQKKTMTLMKTEMKLKRNRSETDTIILKSEQK